MKCFKICSLSFVSPQWIKLIIISCKVKLRVRSWDPLCSKIVYFSNYLCFYWKRNLLFPGLYTESFFHWTCGWKPVVNLVIHKPEVAGISIQTEFQLKLMSESLLLNDRTTLWGISCRQLKIGPKHKLVNSLMVAMPLKFGHFPRQCWALCAGEWCNLSSWVTSWTSQTFWMCFEKQRETAGLFISRVLTLFPHLFSVQQVRDVCRKPGHIWGRCWFSVLSECKGRQPVYVESMNKPSAEVQSDLWGCWITYFKGWELQNWLRTWEIKTSQLKVIPNTNFLEIPVSCLHLESQILTEQFCCFERTALCSAETGFM